MLGAQTPAVSRSQRAWPQRRVARAAAGRTRGAASRVGLARRHRDQLALRPAQRRQLAAEHAAGVDAQRIVHPLGLGDRRVAVDDRRLAAIVGRPVEALGQAVGAAPPGGVAVEAEIGAPRRVLPSMFSRTPAWATARRPSSTQAWLGSVSRKASVRARARRPRPRYCSTVRSSPCVSLTLWPFSQRMNLSSWLPMTENAWPRCGHVHDDAQHVGRVGPAVDEIADEEGAAALRRRGDRAAIIARSFEAHARSRARPAARSARRRSRARRR